LNKEKVEKKLENRLPLQLRKFYNFISNETNRKVQTESRISNCYDAAAGKGFKMT